MCEPLLEICMCLDAESARCVHVALASGASLNILSWREHFFKFVFFFAELQISRNQPRWHFVAITPLLLTLSWGVFSDKWCHFNTLLPLRELQRWWRQHFKSKVLPLIRALFSLLSHLYRLHIFQVCAYILISVWAGCFPSKPLFRSIITGLGLWWALLSNHIHTHR